jgi:transcriptional regulator with XRE-family HTH domain
MTKDKRKKKLLELHQYMDKIGFNQRAIAERSGIHHNTVNSYLCGRQIPDEDSKVFAIAEAMYLKAEEIMEDDWLDYTTSNLSLRLPRPEKGIHVLQWGGNYALKPSVFTRAIPNTKGKNHFAHIARDNNFFPNILMDDFLIFSRDVDTIEDNDIILLRLRDIPESVFLRRIIYLKKNEIQLNTDNPEIPPMTIKFDEIDVLGLLVEIRRHIMN